MRLNVVLKKQLMINMFCVFCAFKMLGINKSPIPFTPYLTYQDHGKQLTIEEKLKKYEGTFQIQLKDIRSKPSIPYNIDELIEKNRKENETIFISIGTQCRLKILSLSEVRKNGNKKPEMISTYK